jgi:hypothetical protein
MYDIGPFLFTGAGWACGIPSVFTQIYLFFQQLKTSFLLCLIKGGYACTQFYLWLGLVYLLLRFIFLALSSLYSGIVITFIRTLYYLK